MTDRPESPDTDVVQALWQGQERETDAMTPQAIRMLVRNDRDHVRQQLLFGFGLIVFEVLGFGWMLRSAPSDIIRAGEVIVLLGLAWIAWRWWRRWPSRAPDASATTQTLIGFQRQELMRRRGGFSWMMIGSAPVIVGAIVTAYGGYRLHPNTPISRLGPFFGILLLWFVVAWIIGRRASRRVQEQIDELDQMGRG